MPTLLRAELLVLKEHLLLSMFHNKLQRVENQQGAWWSPYWPRHSLGPVKREVEGVHLDVLSRHFCRCYIWDTASSCHSRPLVELALPWK